MITTTAMNVTLFSVAVVSLTVLVRVLLHNRASVRTASGRLLAVFGTFALAGLYVWLSLGPEVDARLINDARALAPGVGQVAPPQDV